MIDDSKEYRFPVYTTPPVLRAVQHVVYEKIGRLARLKRPSKAQKLELEQLRAAAAELSATWGDMKEKE